MEKEDLILTIASQAIEIAKLTRENHALKDDKARRYQFLSKAKQDAGYDNNTSFDVIWDRALKLIHAENKYQLRANDYIDTLKAKETKSPNVAGNP